MAKRKNVTKQSEETKNLQIELESPEQQRRIATRSITQLLNKITLTDKQKELLKIINDNKLIVIIGPAGVSKTFSICYYITDLIAKHSLDFKQFILTKPIQESGEKLGFLPGDVSEKIGPYFESYVSNFEQMMPQIEFKKLLEKKKILYEPLAYMRGKSYQNSTLVLDEVQNADLRQIMLFVTRMGQGSKIILAGDVSQYDIQRDLMGLLKFTDMVKDIPSVAVFKFEREDIMRDPILIEITDRYEKIKHTEKNKY